MPGTYALPPACHSSPSLPAFKRSLKQLFLRVQKSEIFFSINVYIQLYVFIYSKYLYVFCFTVMCEWQLSVLYHLE
jgi:hypothetical protein